MVTFNEKRVIPTPVRIDTGQNETINLVRVIACFGVVSIHVHADTPVTNQVNSLLILFCVPYFFSTSLFFLVRSLKKNASINVFLRNSWLRIGVPFLTWSSVYILLLLTKRAITDANQLFTSFSILRAYVYGGSAEHMYYLPELAVMQAIIAGFFIISKRTETNGGWFLLVLSVIYLSWGYVHHYYGVTPLSAVITYICCAFLLSSKSITTSSKKIYLFMGFVLVILTIVNVYTPSASYLSVLPLGGIGLLMLALTLPSFILPSWLSLFSSATYGIYLSHVFFLEAFEFLIEKMHVHLFYTLPVKLSVTLFIFLISLVFTLTVQKIPILRVAFLGEKRYIK